MSTGLELQVLMPVVNAPFRLYWAYNPLILTHDVSAPGLANRADFPNNATYQAYQSQLIGRWDRHSTFMRKDSLFRFSVGRTF